MLHRLNKRNCPLMIVTKLHKKFNNFNFKNILCNWAEEHER